MKPPGGAKAKVPIKQRLLREAKTLGMLVAYLVLFLGGFNTYKRLILREEGINYFHYGYALIESLVLAKVILAGRFLHLGERFHDKPLIVPTLHKTVAFTLLALVFAVGEHIIGGLVEGRAVATVVSDMINNRKGELLAQIVVMFVAFVPLFAIGEISRVMGEGSLFALFFKSRDTTAAPGGPK